MGGEVPKSYYFSGKPDNNNKKSLTVASGSKEHLEFKVERAGDVLKWVYYLPVYICALEIHQNKIIIYNLYFDSYVRWNFHSEESDIGFAVYRKKDSELLPIVPHDRVDCQMSAEEGEIDCGETGVCKFF